MTDLEQPIEARLISPSKASFSQELKAILILGAPLALTQVIQFSVYTVDLLMVGHKLGADSLSGISYGILVYFTIFLFGMGPSMAVAPMVSQSVGKNRADRKSVRGAVRMALWVILFFTPLAALFFAVAVPLLRFANQPVESVNLAQNYIWALAPGLPFALGVMILRNFLAALDRTTIPLVIISCMTAINVTFNWLLMFGPFGLPELGLVGAGIASSIASLCGFLMLIAYIQWDPETRSYDLFKRFWVPHWDQFKEVLSLGWPIGLTTAFEAMLFNVAILLMGWAGGEVDGPVYVAAYQIALNVAAFAFMIPLGLALAGSVRVGIAAGERSLRGVRQAALAAIALSASILFVFGVVVAIFNHTIAGWYIRVEEGMDDRTQMLAASFMVLAAGFMFFDGAQVAANQCLRGLKDVRWPMWAAGISYWPIGFGTAWYLSQHTDVGPYGVWWGLIVGLFTASILLGGRLYWITRDERALPDDDVASVF